MYACVYVCMYVCMYTYTKRVIVLYTDDVRAESLISYNNYRPRHLPSTYTYRNILN